MKMTYQTMPSLARFLGRRGVVSSSRRAFGTVSTSEMVDRCDLHLVTSPYPPIPAGKRPCLYEFITQHWKPHGGYLDKQVAIVDGTTGLQRTYHDHYATAQGLAASLKEMGVNEKSCVALFSPNHVDYLGVSLAVSLCGAQIAPVNPLYTVTELEPILKLSRTSVLIVHYAILETAIQAAKGSDHVKHIIVINDEGKPIPEGTVNLESVRHFHGKPMESPKHTREHTETHAFMLPYSSGTTGLPKGVCLTHSNIVSNLMQYEEVDGLVWTTGQTLISPLPFFHIYAFTVSLLASAWQGHKLITNSGPFDLERFCQLVQEHEVQRAHLVPPICIGLAMHPMVDKYDLSSLRMIISAAAPASEDLELAVEKRIKCRVKQGWGMSELSPIGTLNSDYNNRRGSVGPLISSTVAKILDEHGNSLGPNQPGELVIKGPQVMLGYLDDPEKTAECLSNGWLRTGDLAYYDEDGYFYISDRIKELIKVRGFPVAPAEMEALLLSHDAIADAAVIPKPDGEAGELPRAYIVLKKNTNVSEKELYDWVKERVAPYKRLKGGIVFTDVIPKSASGKILRRLLRDRLQKELSEK